ncbi:uncharacterized protein LOC110025231 [Phalaenopsis equestris]|uniref:uncharacterized protein LOC110025231 n=1 Tax=Phalaenopsis equestris TaxID=78828 RepID=UPI0009E438A4|nr:uncharacterized protein LOC110025231 [Phalaenopsis equestris]
MAALLHLAFPTLRSPPKMHSSCCSVYFRPDRQRCQFIFALRLKKMKDLTLKCLRTTEGMAEIFPSSSLIILVQDFYEHLNKKDMKKLNELLDNSCMFEDLAFPSPFKDKPAVYHFLEELSRAMGQNVRFKIDDVYEAGKQNAGARWHLEWNDRIIPFTKGCSFFYCSENTRGLLIKKACVFVESPVKPGAIVLNLLGFVTSFFDKFPKLAVWFLEKPHVLFQFLMKAYKIFLEPLMLPILIYYTQLWRYGTRFLSLVINLIQNIWKAFL